MAPELRTGFRIAVNHGFCSGCGNCINYCVPGVLARDESLNARGIYAPVVAAQDKCTGCRLCELYCGNFALAVGANPVGGKAGEV